MNLVRSQRLHYTGFQSYHIKNIGIIHNRELQEGVLRIEFDEQDAVEKATDTGCPKYS